MSRIPALRLGALAFVVLLCFTSVPGSFANVMPTAEHSEAMLAAEFATTGASAVIAIHNGRMAARGRRSLGWSLAGITVGAGALWAASSSDSKIVGLDVVAGVAAVVTSVARLPRGHEESPSQSSANTLELNAAPRTLGLRLRF